MLCLSFYDVLESFNKTFADKKVQTFDQPLLGHILSGDAFDETDPIIDDVTE